jgi:hypothetical protein
MNDIDGKNMDDAINTLLPALCAEWNLKPVTVVYVAKTARIVVC